MREEYDIMNLNPRKNPHAKTNKKQVTINLDENVIEYFNITSENSPASTGGGTNRSD